MTVSFLHVLRACRHKCEPSIKDYFRPIGVDKSIVNTYSEAANLNPRKEAEVIKSIEKGVQSRDGGVSKRK